MAQITQHQPTGLPGKIHTFIAKPFTATKGFSVDAKIVSTVEKDFSVDGNVVILPKTAKVLNVIYDSESTGYIVYAEEVYPLEDGDVMYNDDGDNIELDGVVTTDPSFYPLGEVKMLSGNNAGERREIIKDEGSEVTLMWPMPNDVEFGDTYEITPGCDKTGNTCRDKFVNKKNFRGHLYIPRVEETLS